MTRDQSDRVAAVLLCLAVVIHVVMMASLRGGYLDPFFDNTDHFPKGIDFFSIYDAGSAALRGAHIYTLFPTGDAPYASPYRYLPFMAYAVGVPFNALQPWTGYWTWVGINEVMLLANAWLSFRIAGDSRWRWVAAAMWFVFSPYYVEMYMGQWSFLMATLMFWTGVALAQSRAGVAGVPWTLSILEKTNSVLYAPIFVRMREWRVIAVAAAVVVVLNVPYFLLHPEDWSVFWDINAGSYFRDPVTRAAAMATGDLGGSAFVRAVWLTFDTTGTNAPSIVSMAVVAAVVGVSLAATFATRSPGIVRLFFVWSAVFFLVYSSTWEQHFVMLLPALVLLIAMEPRHRLLTLVVFVLVAIPTPYWLFVQMYPLPENAPVLVSPEFAWPRWAGITYHASKLLPVLALWAYLCWQDLRDVRLPRESARADSRPRRADGDAAGG